MVVEFYDSSAFAKLFLNEPGTSFMRARYSSADIRIISRLAPLEVRSAVRRLQQERRLDSASAERVRIAMGLEVVQCTVVPLDESIIKVGESILEQNNLRSL